MLFDDINWMDVESYLEHDDRLIFVTGACEQHAYLSLMADIRIPMSIAAAVAKRTKVLVAPPLNFGVSFYFMDYPGTLSISQATFDLVLTEIVTGLVHHGFRRILFLNGHGGNGEDVPPGVADLAYQVDDLQIKWHNWWKSESVRALMDEVGHNGGHANWMENFPFTRVAPVPHEPKTYLDTATILHGSISSVRDSMGDGSAGGVYELPAEFMQKFFDKVVEEVVRLVESW